MQGKHLLWVALALGSTPALGQDPAVTEQEFADTCQAMWEHHQGVQQKLDEMDAEVQALLEQAREASGRNKTDAVLALVEELVDQRARLRPLIEQLHMRAMMHQMGAGMRMGDMEEHHRRMHGRQGGT